MKNKKVVLLAFVFVTVAVMGVYADQVICHTETDAPPTGGCGFNEIILACSDNGGTKYDTGANNQGTWKNPVLCGKNILGSSCGAYSIVVPKVPTDTCCPTSK